MSTKKIVIYVLIGFIASAVIFGIIFYSMGNKQSEQVAITYKTYEYDMGEFSTNLGSTRNYFKGAIIIETTDEKLLVKFEEKSVELRDKIISTLIGKKAEELLNPEGQLKLKDEIIKVVSSTVNSDKITNIFFKDYIVQ